MDKSICYIRNAIESDYTTIKQISWNQGWISNLRDDYDDALKSSVTLVACIENEIIGFTRAITDGHLTIYLCEIVIRPSYRRKGYGKLLIDHLFNLYPTCRMDLLSQADNFYKSLGFKIVGNGFRKSTEKRHF